MAVEFIGDTPKTHLMSRVSESGPSAPYAETCFISCVIRRLSHRLISYETSIIYVAACVIVSGGVLLKYTPSGGYAKIPLFGNARQPLKFAIALNRFRGGGRSHVEAGTIRSC
jgi:hypothetical protein